MKPIDNDKSTIRILAEWSDYKDHLYCDFDRPISHSLADKVGEQLIERGVIDDYDNEGFSVEIGEDISWTDIGDFKRAIEEEFLKEGYIIIWN